MDELIKNILLRTYKKVRNGSYKDPEIIGLMVNFYKMEKGTHGDIDTRNFYIERLNGVITIRGKEMQYFDTNTRELCNMLKSLTVEDFYSLYLRSSFESSSTELHNSLLSGITSVEGYLQTFYKNQ